MTRRRLPLHLVISLAVLSAPAWVAAQSACGLSTRAACCCHPDRSAAQPCSMGCSSGQASLNESAALAPSSGPSILKSTYALEASLKNAAQPSSTPLVLASLPAHLTHAPPPKRYLLACVFRL